MTVVLITLIAVSLVAILLAFGVAAIVITEMVTLEDRAEGF